MNFQRKKVAIITGSLLTGGAEAMVAQLVSNIDRSKYDVKLICTHKYTNSPIEEFLKQKGIIATYLNKEGGIGVDVFFTCLKIRKILNEFKPNIIHTHLHGVIYAYSWLLFNRCKFIHTLHTIPNKEFGRLTQKLLKVYYKSGKGVLVAISPENQKLTKEYYGIDNIKMIYNPVDIKKYYKLKKNNDEIVFINVGRQDKNKNQELIIKAFKSLNEKINNIKLYLVGDGECNKSLKSLVKAYKLEKNIVFTGIIGNVEDFLAKSDIFVLSSKYEGLPLSVLEAMAAQLPIIATNVGGIKDIVADNGILINSDNLEEMTEAMELLARDNCLREKMSKNSYENIKKFDSSIMAKEYCKIYDEMSN